MTKLKKKKKDIFVISVELIQLVEVEPPDRMFKIKLTLFDFNIE